MLNQPMRQVAIYDFFKLANIGLKYRTKEILVTLRELEIILLFVEHFFRCFSHKTR